MLTHTHLINPDHVSEEQINAFIKAFHGNKDSSHDYREAVRLGLIAANKAENNTGVISEAGIAYICNIFNQGVDHGMVAALEDVVSDKDMEGLAFQDEVAQIAFKLGVEQGKIASSAFTHFDEKSRKKLVHITGFAGIIKLLADLSSYSGFGTSVGGIHAVTSQMVYGMRASGILKTLNLSKELVAFFRSNNLLKEVNEACGRRLSSAHLDDALKAISENKHSFSIGGDGDGGSITTFAGGDKDDMSLVESLIGFEYVNERPLVSDIKATEDKGILVHLNLHEEDQVVDESVMRKCVERIQRRLEKEPILGPCLPDRNAMLDNWEAQGYQVNMSQLGFQVTSVEHKPGSRAVTAKVEFIGPRAGLAKELHAVYGDSIFKFRCVQDKGLNNDQVVIKGIELITWDIDLAKKDLTGMLVQQSVQGDSVVSDSPDVSDVIDTIQEATSLLELFPVQLNFIPNDATYPLPAGVVQVGIQGLKLRIEHSGSIRGEFNSVSDELNQIDSLEARGARVHVVNEDLVCVEFQDFEYVAGDKFILAMTRFTGPYADQAKALYKEYGDQIFKFRLTYHVDAEKHTHSYIDRINFITWDVCIDGSEKKLGASD